jgi:hypothetical protein
MPELFHFSKRKKTRVNLSISFEVWSRCQKLKAHVNWSEFVESALLQALPVFEQTVAAIEQGQSPNVLAAELLEGAEQMYKDKTAEMREFVVNDEPLPSDDANQDRAQASEPVAAGGTVLIAPNT